MSATFVTPHIAFSENTNMVVAFKSGKTDTKTTTIAVKTDNAQGEVASWGKNNKRPQEILERKRLSGVLTRGISLRCQAHYGNGMVLTKENHDNGKKNIEVVKITDYQDVFEFYKKNQMRRFWKETINDLENFHIAFPEYILSNDYKTINRVRRQKTAWCRFEVMNPSTKTINHVYISEQWRTGNVSLDGGFVEKVPVIDSYWSAEEVREYCKQKKIKKFVRPVFYPLTEEAYYPIADYHTVIDNGWLDVVNNIPKYKNAIFENQVSVKYLIEVDERYFEMLYNDDWDEFDPERRREIRQEVIDAVTEHLTTPEKAGKSIQSMKFIDDNGNPQSAITITEIGDKFKKDGAYLPEASAGNSEILFALGLDPSIVGAGIPGGKLGAGSGSDKREAFTILSALLKTNRETTLEIFEFIQDYNEWDPELIPAFENTILTTLDKNPTGTQSVAN